MGTGICMFLEHPSSEMRIEAQHAIVKVNGGKGEMAVGCISTYLTSKSPGAKRAAVEALGEVAPKGNKKAVELLVEAMGDDDQAVGKSAQKALEKVVQKGDSVSLEEIGSHGLANPLSDVRMASVKLLTSLSDKATATLVAGLLQARLSEETSMEVISSIESALKSM